jgi:predicted  nucleic acid-binding Zn-ribbon protein
MNTLAHKLDFRRLRHLEAIADDKLGASQRIGTKRDEAVNQLIKLRDRVRGYVERRTAVPTELNSEIAEVEADIEAFSYRAESAQEDATAASELLRACRKFKDNYQMAGMN